MQKTQDSTDGDIEIQWFTVHQLDQNSWNFWSKLFYQQLFEPRYSAKGCSHPQNMLKTHAKALFKTTRESCISLHGFKKKSGERTPAALQLAFSTTWLMITSTSTSTSIHRGFAPGWSSSQVKWKQLTSRRSLHLAKQEEFIQVSSERVEVWKEQTSKKDIGYRICPDHVSPSLTSTRRFQ